MDHIEKSQNSCVIVSSTLIALKLNNLQVDWTNDVMIRRQCGHSVRVSPSELLRNGLITNDGVLTRQGHDLIPDDVDYRTRRKLERFFLLAEGDVTAVGDMLYDVASGKKCIRYAFDVLCDRGEGDLADNRVATIYPKMRNITVRVPQAIAKEIRNEIAQRFGGM